MSFLKKILIMLLAVSIAANLLAGNIFIVQTNASEALPILTDDFGDKDSLWGDWSKTFDHSEGMIISNENPGYYNCDVWKVMQGSAIPDAYVIYKTEKDISYFNITVHKKDGTSAAPNAVKYYVSSDNLNYAPVEVAETRIKGITVSQQPKEKVPSGKRYLKIVIEGAPNPEGASIGWNPAIGKVEIYNNFFPGEEPPFDGPTVIFTDEFGENDSNAGDWSKTFEHSSGMEISNEDPAFHGGDVWKVQQAFAIPDAYVTYRMESDISYFKLKIHKKLYSSSVPSEIKCYVSQDNLNYTEIPTEETLGSGITVFREPSESIPRGQRFLKIVIVGYPSPSGSTFGWNPRLGAVDIYSGTPPDQTDIVVQEPDSPLRDYSSLEKYKGVHPRIFTDSQKIETVKTAIANDEAIYKENWSALKYAANAIVGKTPAKYVAQTDMLWQRDVGDGIANLAAAYLFSGNQEYFDTALAWAKEAVSYPTWGAAGNEADLEFAHLSTGVSVFYDWCYDKMEKADRDRIRQKLIHYTTKAYNTTLGDDAYVKGYLLGNHTWHTMSGLLIAGIALFDEFEYSTYWMNNSLDIMEKAMSLLGDDGATFEGYSYGAYAMLCLSRYLDLSKKFFDINYFNTNGWFAQNPYYYLYLQLPLNSASSANNGVDFADSWRGASIGPSFFLWLYAREQRNGHAQWLANELVNRGINYPYFTGLLWYDPTVPSESPEDLPLLKHFDDQEIAISRSGWQGDESLVAFKCGPYQGHTVLDANTKVPFKDMGAWHVHPDAGQFSIYGNGEWLIRDDGYSKKTSLNHNTLVINGEGQLGASNNPQDPNDLGFVAGPAQALKARPKITKSESGAFYDYIVGDATEAYDPELGLTKFKRHLIYVKPNILLVVDDIKTKQPANLQLRIFPEQQTSTRMSDDSYYITGKNSKLRIIPLTKDGVTCATDNQTIYQQAGLNIGSGVNRQFVGMNKTASSWVNAVALSWSDSKSIPTEVQYETSGDEMTFFIDGKTIVLNTSDDSIIANENNDIRVILDGALLNFEVPPAFVDGRIIVPYREIFEAYGAEVQWDAQTNVVTGKKDNIEMTFAIGDNKATVNGQEVVLDVPAQLMGDRTMVPLRFVSESLGAFVRWNEENQSVLIYTENYNSPGADDASLSKILISGKEMEGFSSEKTSYDILKTWADATPPLVAIPSSIRSDVVMESTNNVPGEIKITVTSENGRQKNSYTLNIGTYKGIGGFEVFDITASDVPQPENSPGNAMDHNFDTRWSAEGEQWIQFDLGEAKNVSKILLATFSGDQRTSSFEILVSTDGSNWEKVYSGKTSGTTTKAEEFKFTATKSARYVRILGKGNSVNGWNSYTEVGIF